MSRVPAKLKPCRDFFLRAKELEKAKDAEHLLMSTYCGIAFLTKAMPLAVGDNECNMFIMSVMDEVEAKKQNPAIREAFQQQKGLEPEFIKQYASNIFKKADDIDRSGNASKQTAIAYLAASTFYQVLSCYDCPADVEEVKPIIKYSKWKAMDILKALKEGRRPTPGPPGGVSNEQNLLGSLEAQKPLPSGGVQGPGVLSDQSSSSDYVQPPPPSASIVPPQTNLDQKPSAPLPSLHPLREPLQGRRKLIAPTSNYLPLDHVSPGSESDALECARFAVAALEEDDRNLAIGYLQGALHALSIRV